MIKFISPITIYVLTIVVGLVVLACDSLEDTTQIPASDSQQLDETVHQNATQTNPMPQQVQYSSESTLEDQSQQILIKQSPTVSTEQRQAVPRGEPMPIQSLYLTTRNLKDTPNGSSDDLAKLVAHSTLIVIGTVPDKEPQFKRIRGKNPNDSTKSDQNVEAVGNVYEVQVERYLKGNGDTTLPVIQFTGIDYVENGQTIQARDKSENLLLGKSNRYLFFLQEQGQAPNLWIGTAQPYKFLLSGSKAKAESPLDDVKGKFPDRSEADFLNSVENMIATNR